MELNANLFIGSKNVDYTKKSGSRSFNFGGFYVSDKRLVKGNSKLWNILIFDLPAVVTCLNCSDCKDSCYAMKAQRQYADTRVFRNTNRLMFLEAKETLKELIVKQLSKAKQTTVRIHSSGDFTINPKDLNVSQDYLDMWLDIMTMFPNINFYAYTKVENDLNFNSVNELKNFNLITSIIEGDLNFGSLDYCKELNSKYGTFICPATNYKDVKCGKECSHCVTKGNVCFIQH